MKSLLLILSLLTPVLLNAATLKVKVDLEYATETEEIDEAAVRAAGWTIVKGEYEESRYQLEFTLDESKLPYSNSVGSTFVQIAKDGAVSLGVVIGDHDYSSNAGVTLPTENGKLVPFPGTMKFTGSGGDHASGVWSYDAKMEISVLK